jgi:hypothetical protein
MTDKPNSSAAALTVLTVEQRYEATLAVLCWLEESCGKDVAHRWFWEHTPMPCGLPLDDQLEQGLLWAALGREAALPLIDEDRVRIDAEMTKWLVEYRKKQTAADLPSEAGQ